MTTQIIDFSEIDLTGGLRFNGEAIGAAHYNGERLWPFGVDLLYTGGIGGASYLPDAGAVFADTAAATSATFGGSIARANPSGGQSINALQASASLQPLLGRAPKELRNLLTWTEQFDNSSTWLRSGLLPFGSGSVANAALAPDGSMTADFICEDTSTGVHYIRCVGTALGQTATFSVYVKAAGRDHAYIYSAANTFSGLDCRVNLTTGAVTNNAFGTTVTTEEVGNGWWRVNLTMTGTYSGGVAFFALVGPATGPGAGTPSYTGDGASGILVWGAQIELGSTATPYQRVGVATDMTEEGVPSYPFVRFDLSDDRLDTVLPQAVTGDVVIAGRNGSVIAPHSYAANTTFRLGPTSYTGGTPGILRAIGDVVGWSVLGKTLTAAERERLMRFHKRRGAKGLLVPGGPELVTNGTFNSDINGWVAVGTTISFDARGAIRVDAAGQFNRDARQVGIPTIIGAAYVIEFDVLEAALGIGGGPTSGLWAAEADASAYATTVIPRSITAPTRFTAIGVSTSASSTFRLGLGSSTGFAVFDNVSVRELRPEEDW